MSDDKIFDERISSLVRGVERAVPPALETRIRAAAGGLQPRPKISALRRPLWLALVPGAAAAILAALLWLPVFQKPPQPLSEIRTEFELPGKNIKIVFFQKPGFNLFKEN